MRHGPSPDVPWLQLNEDELGQRLRERYADEDVALAIEFALESVSDPCNEGLSGDEAIAEGFRRFDRLDRRERERYAAAAPTARAVGGHASRHRGGQVARPKSHSSARISRSSRGSPSLSDDPTKAKSLIDT